MKTFLTALIFLSCTSLSFSQLTSGLLLSGGTGSLRSRINYESPFVAELDEAREHSSIDYRFNVALGYRFRLKPAPDSFFYDMDLNIGMRRWNSSYGTIYALNNYSASSAHYFASICGTVNHPLYKGLSAGLGIEPTYYFYTEGENVRTSPAIDAPLVARLSYNLKFVEVGVSYKYGLFNVMETDYLKSGRFNDLVFSLYIPF